MTIIRKLLEKWEEYEKRLELSETVYIIHVQSFSFNLFALIRLYGGPLLFFPRAVLLSPWSDHSGAKGSPRCPGLHPGWFYDSFLQQIFLPSVFAC